MNIEEIKKEYIKFLNDTKRSGTNADKKTFKNNCAIWFIQCYGIENPKTIETIKKLNDF